jgi:hypothetical protein
MNSTIVVIPRGEFFGIKAPPNVMVHCAFYGTKLIGAFETRRRADRALRLEPARLLWAHGVQSELWTEPVEVPVLQRRGRGPCMLS